MIRNSFNKIKPASFFRQIRHAEVVHSPASIFFGGHHNNWGNFKSIKCFSRINIYETVRINRIANEASRVKVDYDSKYALKLKLAAEKY
jgi:ATP synthase F1 complex assembly factor 1